MKRLSLSVLAILLVLPLVLPLADAQAGPLRDRIRERVQERQVSGGSEETDRADRANLADMGGSAQSCAEWSQKVNRLQKRANGRNAGPAPLLENLSYGSEPLQNLDVFLPQKAGNGGMAPIILMVHGGGWCVGDKAGAQMTANKVARWVPKGFIFVSVNYPMVSRLLKFADKR